MQWDVVFQHRDLLAEGLVVTLEASAASLVLSTLGGLVLGLADSAPVSWIRSVARVYVEVFQNTPYLIVVLFMYHGLANAGLLLSPMGAGVLGLSLYSAAYMAEAIRSGIRSIHRGQWDAARVSGLNYLQTMRRVVLPQGLVYALPPLTNQWVRLVKNTSILAVIAGGDLLYQTNLLVAQTYVVFEFYIVVAAVYLVITVPLSRAAEILERRIGWKRVAGALGAAR
jgi:putative glutamine transport system permease protein